MDDFLDRLSFWTRTVAVPFIYENLASLLPSYQFRRYGKDTQKDHWGSACKIDGSSPKVHREEKTVVYQNDMRLREQGDWNNPVGVVDALMKEYGLDSHYKVYVYLSERYGLGIPSPKQGEGRVAGGGVSGILETLRDYFVWNLWNNGSAKAAAVRSYLVKKRGFERNKAQALLFGYVPDWNTVTTYMTLKMGFRKEDLDSVCRVCGDDGKTMVGKTHTLAIPYVCGGVLKGFQFRRIDSDQPPKYIVNTGLDRKSVFFNMPSGNVSEIVVVEGEMDALVSMAGGIPNVVAVGGSDISGDRRRQVDQALSVGVTRIVLCPDLDTDANGNPDRAKRYRCILRSIHTIRDVRPEFDGIYVAEFPCPSDPDEFIRRNGVQSFRELLDSAKPWWQYVCEEHRWMQERRL